MKNLSKVFWLLAVLLSDAMCAVVAYSYCDLTWAIKYAGYSAPASVAFVTGIPFAVGIIVCVVLANFFKRENNVEKIEKE